MSHGRPSYSRDHDLPENPPTRGQKHYKNTGGLWPRPEKVPSERTLTCPMSLILRNNARWKKGGIVRLKRRVRGKAGLRPRRRLCGLVARAGTRKRNTRARREKCHRTYGKGKLLALELAGRRSARVGKGGKSARKSIRPTREKRLTCSTPYGPRGVKPKNGEGKNVLPR